MSTGTQTEVVMPQMGVSVSEGTVTKWLRQVGEPIQRDEPLLEISTDKVDTEVPSPGEGVVAEIRVQEGETVEVGTVLALIAPAGADVGAPEAAPAAPAPAPSPLPSRSPRPSREAAPAAPRAFRASRGDARAGAACLGARRRPGTGRRSSPRSSHASPRSTASTRRRSRAPGTGGRVTKKDILAFIESGAAAAPPTPPVAPTPEPEPVAASRSPSLRAEPVVEPEPVAAHPHPSPSRRRAGTRGSGPRRTGACRRAQRPPASPSSRRRNSGAAGRTTAAEPVLVAGESLEPMTAMRRGVMEHMRRSVDTAAHVTSAIEVDMARVVALRQKLKPELAAQKVNLTYLAFIARATVDTLRDYPWVNGELRGQSIVTRPFVNLGIAVALDEGKGLIVPVIRNAQDLNLVGTARAIQDLAERARTKKLLPDDVQGGTFTITNPGSFGTFHGTPIINQPQSAILGTYALVKRPWVVQDELGSDVIAIRPLMNLTLTYDHRLVDGAYAGMCLRDLRERLESWDEAAY